MCLLRCALKSVSMELSTTKAALSRPLSEHLQATSIQASIYISRGIHAATSPEWPTHPKPWLPFDDFRRGTLRLACNFARSSAVDLCQQNMERFTACLAFQHRDDKLIFAFLFF